MEYAEKNLDWNGNAGQRLDELARALPHSPRLELTVFGSAPLQLLVEKTFLSEDIDISPPEDAYDLVTKIVEEKGWAKGQSDFYIQVLDGKQDERTRYVAVLEIPPVLDAVTAVRVSVVKEIRKQK